MKKMVETIEDLPLLFIPLACCQLVEAGS